MRFIYILAVVALSAGCAGQEPTPVSKAPAQEQKLSWQKTKEFAFYADEETISARYPHGRWLEQYWVYKKPEYAKIVSMYPAENGIICEGIGLLDVKSKSATAFDRLETVAVSDGATIFTTNPQTSDYVKAVRTSDGSKIWQARIGEKSRGQGEFFFVDGCLVFLLETSQGYRLTRFDRKSGSIVWQDTLTIDSGFSSIWTEGSGHVWILTTIQSGRLKNVLTRINAKTGEFDMFDSPFRKPFAASGGHLWFLVDGKLKRFTPDSGQTVEMPAKDALSIQNVSDYLLLNSTRQPKVLDPRDATNHMLFPDQVQMFGGVVFQVLQKIVVAVDPVSRDELWKMDFEGQVQSVAFSPACVAIQTTDSIHFFWKK